MLLDTDSVAHSARSFGRFLLEDLKATLRVFWRACWRVTLVLGALLMLWVSFGAGFRGPNGAPPTVASVVVALAVYATLSLWYAAWVGVAAAIVLVILLPFAAADLLGMLLDRAVLWQLVQFLSRWASWRSARSSSRWC